MSKINPAVLARRERPVFSEKFTDPDQPGIEVELRIRKVPAGSLLDLWAREQTELLVEKYVTGTVDENGNLLLKKDKTPLSPPQQFPMLDGPWLEVGALSRLSIALACRFAAMERAGDKPEADRYDPEDFIRFQVTMETAWGEMMVWANGVGGAEGQKGGAPQDASASENSPPPPPSATDSPSPTSLTTSSPASTACSSASA